MSKPRKPGEWEGIARGRLGKERASRPADWQAHDICEHGSPRRHCGARHGPYHHQEPRRRSGR